MSSFIPSNPTEPTSETVTNDGFFPDLETADFKARTGLGDIFGAERLTATLQSAMIEVNASLKTWRALQTVSTLADVPATIYGETSEKVTLYETAVFARARAVLLGTTRDYDATKDGHDKADALEKTADDWMAASNEALSRLTERPRTIVELI